MLWLTNASDTVRELLYGDDHRYCNSYARVLFAQINIVFISFYPPILHVDFYATSRLYNAKLWTQILFYMIYCLMRLDVLNLPQIDWEIYLLTL